jgi:hypothetical protein
VIHEHMYRQAHPPAADNRPAHGAFSGVNSGSPGRVLVPQRGARGTVVCCGVVGGWGGGAGAGRGMWKTGKGE